jgi:hypothetical protein
MRVIVVMGMVVPIVGMGQNRTVWQAMGVGMGNSGDRLCLIRIGTDDGFRSV